MHGERVTISRVIFQVSSTTQYLVRFRKHSIQRVPHRWTDVLHMMENYTPKLKIVKVLWEFPMIGWIKINTDGASTGNPGRSSIGFCIKDELGDVIYACGKTIQETTNTVAEALAILEALRYAAQHNFNYIWLQTVSMLLNNVIEGCWKPPWLIVDHVEEIGRLLERCTCKVSHIYREGNKLADHLANYAIENGTFESHGYRLLDTQGRRIVNGDKLQCPYLRVKVARG
ncbi:uncharacterized protein LOC142166891 [Nicotiana tabacum]|uniref:Uncharacterized protein LOC142166891 n=1 Tax=Nicotiana tabacum TaxID=4097 RepID=A0AC58SCK3_TOBAC